MRTETVVNLRQEFFSEKERTLLQHGELSVSLFRYETGVAAMRISNARGQMVMLPFQGMAVTALYPNQREDLGAIMQRV